MPAPSPNERFEQITLTVCRAAADGLAASAGFLVSGVVYTWLIRSGWLDQILPAVGPYSAVAMLFSVACLGVFWYLGLYERHASVLNLWELQTAIKGILIASAVFLALFFFLQLGEFSRLVITAAIPTSALLIILERRFLSGVLGRLQATGRVGRRVLIYGCGPTGRLLMKKIAQAPHLDCTVVGFLDDSALIGSFVSCRLTQTGPLLFQAPVLGRWQDWMEVVAGKRIDELLVAAPSFNSDRLREVLQFSQSHPLQVGIVPHLEDLRPDQLRVEDLSAISVLRPHASTRRDFYLAGKRLFDLAVATALLALTSPVWIVAAVAIRLNSPGPVLFVQQRAGLNGKRFRMLKFRTMRLDTDPYAASPAGDVDPRITPVGRILRMGGLDELPQLINVLRGEMSLVGPRPEMPFIVERYTALERQRLRATPGITGVWQLSADRHAEIHENLEYDLYYINHRSLVIDALILVETLFFTGSVLFGAVTRTRAAGAPPKLPASGSNGDQSYLFLALDQRRNGAVPQSWRTCLPAACAVARRWRVKVLVAGNNVPIFDRLLEESLGGVKKRDVRAEFVDDRGRFELRSLVEGAKVVMTDLPHVEAWAIDAGVDVLGVRDTAVHWLKPSRSAAAIVNELKQTLPLTIERFDTTAESGRDAQIPVPS